jgi:hypothetical protein
MLIHKLPAIGTVWHFHEHGNATVIRYLDSGYSFLIEFENSPMLDDPEVYVSLDTWEAMKAERIIREAYLDRH